MTPMTSKERVRAALGRQPVDKVPVDYEAADVVTERLIRDNGFENFEQLMEHYNVDVRWFPPMPTYTGRTLKKWPHEDGKSYYQEDVLGFTRFYYWTGVCYNWQEADTPLAGEITMENIDRHPWPNPDKFNYDEVKYFCDAHPGKAIAIGRSGFFQRSASLRGFEQLMTDFYLEPELAHKIIDRLADVETEIYERMFEAGEGQVDFMRTCDDYGSQISTLMSPEIWEEFFAENTKKFTSLCHRHGGYFMQHSCGAIRPFIPKLIECGVDALDPIQKVPGLEPQGLKDDFGDKITFHGGIDTQGLLPSGTPEEVSRETREYIRILNRNQTGYILTSSQSLEPDIPTANIEAMYCAAREG